MLSDVSARRTEAGVLGPSAERRHLQACDQVSRKRIIILQVLSNDSEIR
jgi:hypothetical protein